MTGALRLTPFKVTGLGRSCTEHFPMMPLFAGLGQGLQEQPGGRSQPPQLPLQQTLSPFRLPGPASASQSSKLHS